jgi:hypothetical protein
LLLAVQSVHSFRRFLLQRRALCKVHELGCPAEFRGMKVTSA